MGIASLVIGIIALGTALIPFLGAPAIFPALVGLGLGIGHIATARSRQQPKGVGIAGVVLNAIALVVVVGWLLLAFYFGQAFGDFVQQHGGTIQTQPSPSAPMAPASDPSFKPMTPVDEPADSDSTL